MPTYQTYTINRENATATTGSAPSGVSDGDLLVAIVVTFAASESHTVPSGWSLEDETNGAIAIMSRVASSSDTSWEFGGSAGTRIRDVLIVRFTDATVDQVIYAGASPGEGEPANLPSITTTEDGSVVLYFASTPGTRSFDYWVGTTNIYLNDQRLCAASYINAPTAGTYSGNQIDLDNNSSSVRMYSLALSSASATYNEEASGGAVAGGEASDELVPFYLDPVGCACNTFTETASGGVVTADTSTVSDTVVRGGVVLGGSALVAVPSQNGDGYIFVYPLDAQYDGTSGEVDGVASGLDGTAGGLEYPTLDEGVYCLGSNNFADNEYISLPADNLSGNKFSLSAWVKINGYYRERVWYSRGFNTVGGDQWSIRFGHSVINNVWASVQTSEGEYHCFSSFTMERERWYHVACSCDGSELKVYLNGVLRGTTSIEGDLVELGNSSYIARYNNGIGLNDGNLQELKMVPDAKSAAWFLAEYENFCSSGWYLVSPTVTISP